MSWGAVIAVGGSIIGGAVASEGSKKAGEKAAEGSEAAIAESRRQFDTIRGDNLGRINIGNQAFNALGGMYGYSPTVGSPYQTNLPPGATPYAPSAPKTGVMNSGVGSVFLNPATPGLGAANYVFNPAGAIFNALTGNKHGDEKRNLAAFTKENQIYDLGNGMLALADGTQFREDQLQDIAGDWYGATYAPDGNQAEWQQRYKTRIGALPKANVGQTNGLTSDGVNQGMSAGGSPTSLSAPDYSAFFKSPDYQFRKDQGMEGIGNAFSASGGAKSGNALKALAEFNSNLAGGEFGNYFNRQAAIAGIGQTSSNTSASAGISTGAQVGNALQSAGDARASGVSGQYNALGAGISDLALGAGYWNANRKNPLGAQANNWGYGPPRGSYA